MDVATLLQSLANGVVLGAILALGAIGLTLVYGILNLANFAHGDTMTFGAYMVLFFSVAAWPGREHLLLVGALVGLLCVGLPLLDMRLTRRLGRAEAVTLLSFGGLLLAATLLLALLGPGGAGSTVRVLVLATLLAAAATALLSVGLEFVLWRPLRRRGATVLSLVIASLGLSLLLRNAIQQFFGGDFRTLQRPSVVSPAYFGVRISDEALLTFAATAVLIGLVHLFLTRTRVGKAMRALADNRDLARVCGIDVDRVIVYVWIISGTLVAVAGLFLSLQQNNNVNIGMGFGMLIPIFAAVVLGGIGSPYGAMVGGLVVGIAMRIGPAQYDLAMAFAVLIVVLLVRPQGILGRKA